MNDLLEDWILFSEGKRGFEKSHFLGLFKNQLNEKQLLSVFAGIPSGATLYQRTKNVLDSSSLDSYLYFQPKSDANRLLMVSAAKTWLEELSRYCVERGNSKPQGIVAGSRVVVQDRKSFQMPISSDTPAGWMLSFVGDEVDYALGDVGPVIDGLMEALYGLGRSASTLTRETARQHGSVYAARKAAIEATGGKVYRYDQKIGIPTEY